MRVKQQVVHWIMIFVLPRNCMCVCVCVQVRQYCIRLHNEYNHVVWMRYWIASNDNDVDAAIGVSAALPSITSENMAHSFEVGFEIYTQANRLAVVLH
jgi:hypothetical protein